MKGHVARKRDRYYAVIYEGLDPVTGKERRTWHPAGTDRAEAEALVARLAAERDGRNDEVRSLTFGAYLTHQWLPAKQLELRVSTHRSYVQKTQRHILPALGRRRPVDAKGNLMDLEIWHVEPMRVPDRVGRLADDIVGAPHQPNDPMAQ